MKRTECQVLKPWLIRAGLVLLVTGSADCATAWFAQQPLRWCALIGASLPLSMTLFVIIPMLRQESRKS